MLGDAAGLAGDDVGLADRVEQRGLAVVDVAHDGDDRRRAALSVSGDVVCAIKPSSTSASETRRTVWPNSSAMSCAVSASMTSLILCICALLHQELDDVDGALGHAVGELLDGDRVGDDDVAGDLLLRGLKPEACLRWRSVRRRKAASERARSSSSLSALDNGQLAAAAVGLGLGDLGGRHLDLAADPTARALALLILDDGGGERRPRSAARRSGCGPFPRRGACSRPRRGGGLPRRPCGGSSLALGSFAGCRNGMAARLFLGPLAVLGLADAGGGERTLARLLLVGGQGAQHDSRTGGLRARTIATAAGSPRPVAAWGWPARVVDWAAPRAGAAPSRARPAGAAAAAGCPCRLAVAEGCGAAAAGRVAAEAVAPRLALLAPMVRPRQPAARRRGAKRRRVPEPWPQAAAPVRPALAQGVQLWRYQRRLRPGSRRPPAVAPGALELELPQGQVAARRRLPAVAAGAGAGALAAAAASGSPGFAGWITRLRLVSTTTVLERPWGKFCRTRPCSTAGRRRLNVRPVGLCGPACCLRSPGSFVSFICSLVSNSASAHGMLKTGAPLRGICGLARLRRWQHVSHVIGPTPNPIQRIRRHRWFLGKTRPP